MRNSSRVAAIDVLHECLPDAGDLADAETLTRVLARRASATREIIFMLTDEHHVRLALNLLLNLEELHLRHHLVVANSRKACKLLWARARVLGLSIGCGTSSFLRRGVSARHDAGLNAYGIEDGHVYHLWWQRWYFLSEAVGRGYRVLSLDTDGTCSDSPASRATHHIFTLHQRSAHTHNSMHTLPPNLPRYLI